MNNFNYFIFAFTSVLGLLLLFIYKQNSKKAFLVLAIISFWLSVTNLLTGIFGKTSQELHVEIFTENVEMFGLSINETVVTLSILTIAITALCLIFRLIVFPGFSEEKPFAFQTLMEAVVEWTGNYTKSTSELSSNMLGGYIFSVGLMMIGSAFCEMLGVRSPTSDLLVTGALAIMTSVLIQYYGVKTKGAAGRVKSLTKPTAIVFPFKVIEQFSTPVSLACRLFGNMLGGLIIMELLYVALGNAGVGVPAALGLYFNVFHPLIQAYIFITLSLTFIGEAAE